MSKPRRKRRAHWAAYLWPGLPHLWVRGSVAGLVLAVGFTVLLNLLILSTLVWPEWLAPRVRLACAASAGVVWVAALVETRGELRRLAEQKETGSLEPHEKEEESITADSRRTDARLSLAQKQYLCADWAGAERTLRLLLRAEKEDVEAQLLLVGVHRRTGRTSDALRRLRRLSTREDANRWRFEIGRERELLERASEPVKNEETPPQAA